MLKILVSIIVITMLIHCSSPAPTDLHQFELSMLNKLHKPWYSPDKPQKEPQYPRKGEYPCNGRVCRTKVKCEDCQYAKPKF